MLVVKADLPQILSREDIHVSASNRAVSGPDDPFQIQCAKKHSGVGFSLEGGWLTTAKVGRSSDVGSAVQVLTTGVEKVDLIVVEFQGSALFWLVVNNGAIRTDRADCVERGTLVEITVGAKLVKDASARKFVKRMVRLAQLFLKEGEVLHDRGAVTNVARVHACHLGSILGTLRVFDRVVGFDSRGATNAMVFSVASLNMNTHLHTRVGILDKLVSKCLVGAHLDFLTGQVVSNVGDLGVIDEKRQSGLIS